MAQNSFPVSTESMAATAFGSAAAAAAASATRFLSSAATPTLPLSSRSSFKSLRSSPHISPLFLNQGRPRSRVSTTAFDAASNTKCSASDAQQLKSAKEDIKELLNTTFCHPILVRLGWHDAGTYNKNIDEWPRRGGANGSLRFDVELGHGANAGLVNALKLIEPIKKKYSNVTYADLFQLASATAIEEAGGPKIPMKYGRVDVVGPEQCPEEGRLPG